MIQYEVKKLRIEKSLSKPDLYDNGKEMSFNLILSNGVGALPEKNSMYSKLEMEATQGALILMEFAISSVIQFKKSDFDRMIDGDDMVIPKELAQSLTGLMYSSIRGAVLLKNKNNKLRDIILPQINPKKFILDDIIISKTQ
jgi:hypothetical protein